MKYLFDEKDGVIDEVRAQDRRAFFLDYDGTLTPIVRDPHKAFLSPEHRRIIASLLGNENNLVCVISGRAIEQLEAFIGLKGLILAGNHGMEIAGPDISYVNDVAIRTKPRLREIAEMLKKKLSDFEGVLVEDKGLTVSVHYRMLPVKRHDSLKESFYREMEKFLASNTVIVTRGNRVFEVRPNVIWHKGSAVKWILGSLSGRHCKVRPFPIYMGDDETDEDAFNELKGLGLTILVSPRKRASEACYFIRSVEETYQFLECFAH
ncbi:MAG: trehalose-phosphatase [Syntrophobacterales bacterium]|nr:MAG: trehalose-phosphatase [Syntrophobacterales bacterium]